MLFINKLALIMEEILDQAFNENEKDETRINRIIGGIRLLYSVLLFCTIAYLQMTYIGDNGFDFSRDFIAIIIINFIGAFFIYYNVKSAFYELRDRFVISVFDKRITLIFIGLSLPLILIYIFPNLIRKVCVVGFWDLIYLISGICLALILIREIIYYKRATRLKRLNNE